MKTVTVTMRLPVNVRTYDPKTDEVDSEFVVDYATHEGRRRIGRHSGWALNNGFGVEVEPVQ